MIMRRALSLRVPAANTDVEGCNPDAYDPWCEKVRSPQISPHIPASPHISPYLPIYRPDAYDPWCEKMVHEGRYTELQVGPARTQMHVFHVPGASSPYLAPSRHISLLPRPSLTPPPSLGCLPQILNHIGSSSHADCADGDAPTPREGATCDGTRGAYEWTEWFKALQAEPATMQHSKYSVPIEHIQTWIDGPGGMPQALLDDVDATLVALADVAPTAAQTRASCTGRTRSGARANARPRASTAGPCLCSRPRSQSPHRALPVLTCHVSAPRSSTLFDPRRSRLVFNPRAVGPSVWSTVAKGMPWGGLNELLRAASHERNGQTKEGARRDAVLAPGAPFPPPELNDETRPWIDLVKNGSFSNRSLSITPVNFEVPPFSPPRALPTAVLIAPCPSHRPSHRPVPSPHLP